MRTKLDEPFSTAEALRYGWRTTLANMKPLLAIGVVGAFLALLNRALTMPGREPGLHSLLALVIQILQVGVTLAFIRVALGLYDRRPVDLSRPGLLLRDFFPFLLTCFVYGLLVAVGLLLLIVPGVIWGLKYAFAGFLVVDEELDPIEAFRKSSHLTDGIKGQLFWFALAIFGVNLLGAIALGVGLLVTIPTTMLAATYVFRRLQARALSLHAAALPSTPGTAGPAAVR